MDLVGWQAEVVKSLPKLEWKVTFSDIMAFSAFAFSFYTWLQQRKLDGKLDVQLVTEFESASKDSKSYSKSYYLRVANYGSAPIVIKEAWRQPIWFFRMPFGSVETPFKIEPAEIKRLDWWKGQKEIDHILFLAPWVVFLYPLVGFKSVVLLDGTGKQWNARRVFCGKDNNFDFYESNNIFERIFMKLFVKVFFR